MTTLADHIAELQTQANKLLDLPQQIADAAQARVEYIGNYYANLTSKTFVAAYVDQANGADDAEGTEAAPLQSISAVLERTPPGACAEVRLMGPYRFSQIEYVQHRYLRLRSASSVRHALTLERVLDADDKRVTGGIGLVQGGVDIQGLSFAAPLLDGFWPNYAAKAARCGLVQVPNTTSVGRLHVSLRYMDITTSTSDFCPLIGLPGGGAPLALYVYSVTAAGAGLTGHLLSEAADPAGTTTTTLPWLVSNLTTV